MELHIPLVIASSFATRSRHYARQCHVAALLVYRTFLYNFRQKMPNNFGFLLQFDACSSICAVASWRNCGISSLAVSIKDVERVFFLLIGSL